MNNKTHPWNAMIAALPGAHFMQTIEWAEVKAQTGWQPLYQVWYPKTNTHATEEYHPSTWEPKSEQPAAAALVLRRTIPMRGFSAKLRILYVPKGPLLDWENIFLRRQVIKDLKTLARQQGAIFMKIDPDVVLGEGAPDSPEEHPSPVGLSVLEDLSEQGWRFSDEQIQFRNTVIIDLRHSEEELLARMKQKTRYNVRLAERRGVTIRSGSMEDLHLLYQMYAETSLRDGFVIRSADYYYKTWQTFMQSGMADILIAEVNNEPVAAVIIFVFAGNAWYVYGMSRDAHREKMPNYLLQWRAMQLSREKGCTRYDLWGAPDHFTETDSLWNVFRFKEGLGGQVIRHIGAWDLPTRPFLYHLYTKIFPQILALMRRRGIAETKRNIRVE